MKSIEIKITMLLVLAIPVRMSAAPNDLTDSLMDMSLDALTKITVTAASRKAERVKDAPSNITVVDDEQIKAWGCRDLNDVAVRIAGFTSLIDRDEDVLAVRGNVSDNNQKYMILIDGHPFNSFENFGPANLVLRPMDLSNVKQVEFIRGPGAVAWGPGALAGVINIVTKSGADLAGVNSLTVGYGSFSGSTANFQIGKAVGKDADLIISGAFSRSNGEKITQAASAAFSIAPPAPVIPGYNPPKEFTTLYHQEDPSYMLQARARVGDFKINAFTYNSSVFNRHIESDLGRKDSLENQRYFIEGGFDHTLANDVVLSAKVSLQQDHERYNPVAGIPFDAPAVYYGTTYATGAYFPPIIDWNDRVENLNASASRSFLDGKLNASAAWDVKLTHFGPNMRTDSTTNTYMFDRQYNETVIGGYIGGDYQLAQKVRLSAATWVDHNKDRGKKSTVFCPRVALLWDPTPTLTVKAIYNQSVLRPSNFQMGKPNTPTVNQPESESMSQAELIVMKQYDRLNFTVTAFSQRLSKFINIGNNFVFQNLGDYEAKGLEFEVNGAITRTLEVWANVSGAHCRGLNFNRTLVVATPDQVRTDATDVVNNPNGKLLNYPSLMGNLGVTVHTPDRKLFVSPSVRAQNAVTYRIATPSAPAVTSYAPLYGSFPARALVDLSIGYEPNKTLGFYISGHNIFDNRDRSALSIYNGYVTNPGRYIEGKIKFSF